MTEQDTPLENLLGMAAEMLPAYTNWPERLLALMHGTPTPTGIWRTKKIPDAMVGWPIAMHAGTNVAGCNHPMEGLHKVKAFAESMRRAGVQIDLTFERAVEATKAIHGIVVPLQSMPADEAQGAQYRDIGFDRYWIPLAQVWRFKKPVPRTGGHRGIFYLDEQTRAECVEALRTATRVL